MNLYLVVAVLAWKKLRKLQYYPVFLMAFGDLMTSGFAAFLNFLVENSSQYSDENSIGFLKFEKLDVWNNYYYNWYSYGSWSFSHLYWLTCFPLVLYHRVNEYVTGLCMLVLATERFIIFCKPEKVDVLLTVGKRKLLYTIMTVTLIGLTAFEILYRYYTFEIYQYLNCSYGFLPGDHASFLSMIGTGVVFFIIPAGFSLVMYVAILFVLFNAEGERKRNRLVTIALACSCLVWVVLWTLKYVFQIVHYIISFYASWEFSWEQPYIAQIVTQDTAQFFPIFSSVTNPFVLLVVCRVFREPIVRCFRCGKGREDEDEEIDMSECG
ncbi:uncharacterized protein LOC142340070 isoform X2 [Convolutriloba macropyga]|uniref:uncharacterized protein LOC142340070 isoform X2 n=1 Tax=Convolutriloba macropyga TaxID=536237 RepID=UPI003F51C3D7